MGPDKYKVEILHYINPHLIWVLVRKEGNENICNFEQIGIYGILPLEITIDIEGNVETKKCEEWLPAIFVAMKKILLDATEVWFSVTFLDRTISIFDDNVHKYGDLIIKMKDGKTVSMLEKLLETGFAAEDVQYFHQNLKTKLDYITTVSVINKIKQSFQSLNVSTTSLEKALSQQTFVLQQSIELDLTTTPRNLDLCNRENHVQLLQRKQQKDLNACKDVDETSAGRASRVKTVNSSCTLNTGLRKKLNLIKGPSECSERKSVMCKSRPDETTLSIDKNVDEYVYETVCEPDEPFKPRKMNIKAKKSKTAAAGKDKKLVILGPPGLNPSSYHPQEVDIEKDAPKTDEPITDKTIEKAETEDFEYKQDMYERTDSEVNLKMSNMKLKIIEDRFFRKQVNSDNSDDNTSKEKVNIKSPQHLQAGKQVQTSVHRKMKFLKEKIAKMNDSSSTTETDSAARQGDDSDSESISALVDKLDIGNGITKKDVAEPDMIISQVSTVKNNVNPFKNLDGSKSVFVEKLVTPTLMVHTKKGNRIQPVSDLRDVPFGKDIHIVLRNMSIKKPMRPQTVSWPTILRGHSLFLVSPYDSGKTIGYLPAVCRLVSDFKKSAVEFSVARLTCIIVCATAKSVSNLEELCSVFIPHARIFACYAGMDDLSISTSILNGCDILICTPTSLVRLMRENLGLDLRNLYTFVIDDCERISEVYQNELKFCLFKVKEMLKGRINKEMKVQYVVVSRIWCDFMSSLAKKAPDSVVCIGAFQECVLYSEVNTSVSFLKKEDKVNALLNFLKDIDKSKKTVIVCRSDDEVYLIEKTLTSLKYVVFACDNSMTVQDLYSIDLALSEYEEPLLGPILVCCDGNLAHMNVTDAHYLVHFSLPELFSTFCKRFSALIDNYQSIFDRNDSDVKIKILLENNNVEQLPKILNFIKRCSDNVPEVLDQISTTVISEKDLKKAQMCVPLCHNLLTLGKCPDFWNCKQRHGIFQDYDQPPAWMPRDGIIAFKILHYHSAVHYSARLISCASDNDITKYPQTYSKLSIKLGMYYSKENNKKLHGVAKPGDVCAVSLKQNLFARCQVMKILKHNQHNIPTLLLINLIDEEKFEMARDTCLYHLPDELKSMNTHVAKVILANITPQDRDITFSKLAEYKLKKITEKNEDLFMRGQISLVIGNHIFVEKLEACQDLSSLNETVVKSNFRDELLDGHAVDNPDHISALEKLGDHLDFMRKKQQVQSVSIPKLIKVLPKPRWAHLESDTHAPVYYLYAKSPELFFVQHEQFQNCLKILLKDIDKYVSDNPEPAVDVKEGDIVLAEFPNDSAYERARVDNVIDDSKVNCFFVDLGDWAIVPTNKLLSITEKIITQLPFQAIECRLVGIKPIGENWSEFSTNWLVDQFYGTSTDLKYLFAKRFTKEKAEFTEGSKYGIGLIDTYDDDVYINKLMIDANLAEENDEVEFLNVMDIEVGMKLSPGDNNPQKNAVLVQTSDKQETYNKTDEKEKSPVPEPPQEVKKRSIPSYLLSYSKKKESSKSSDIVEESLDKTNIQVIRNEAIAKPSQSQNISSKDNSDTTNHDSKSDCASIQPVKDQLALTNITQGSSEKDSEGDLRANQKNIMNLFRNKPLRSVPLVESDDIDDDRWDCHKPAEMVVSLMQENKSVNPVQTNLKAISDVASKSQTENDREKICVGEVKKWAAEDKAPLKVRPASIVETNNVAPQTKSNTPPQIRSNTPTQIKSNTPTQIKNNTTPQYKNIKSEPEKHENDDLRKPKLVWRQNRNNVIIKIMLVTVKYDLTIKDKYITFYANANDEKYGFDFELYGVIDVTKSSHSNKGQYIQVNLVKVMAKNWLILGKGYIKKWIVYDVDNMDVSSEEEDATGDSVAALRNNLKFNRDSESDEDFYDDTDFRYKK